MKRTFDLIVAFILLFMFFPVIIVIALLIKAKLGSPIIFKQERPGLYGKPFYLYKFRTMTSEKNKAGVLLPDHRRLTSFGQFIRKYSLDEIPQLLNVIRGHISLVGPRPLLMEYLPLYTTEQFKRHNVRPGITGWAQVNGRNAITWEEKFALDLWYVTNHSFLLDIKVLILTVYKVFKSEGINQVGQATVDRFNGQNTKVSGGHE
ncbi:sugar transferase [Alteribacter populi]|uniref:sugar transferase n=1 Tax=Alteribacter populi TaxID=2011011 RepID=UPI000BBA4822|nr:sugar transferase [Alteribacter populi]